MSRWLKILLCAVAGGFGIANWSISAGPQTAHEPVSSNETAAIYAIRTLHSTQVQYFSQFGRYAVSLKELGPPSSGAPGPEAAGLIDGELASGAKAGYAFTMAGHAAGYVIHAHPQEYGKSGSRTFYSDQTMVIRQNHGPELATADSPELK